MSEVINFEKYINEHDKLIYTNVGVSMLPLLRQGKDLFILKKKNSERCKVGDVVLYKKTDRYILHRIIQVRANDYVILGDNCIEKEYGITDRDIIAVMSGFVRNGKEHSVNEFSYKIYSFIFLKTILIRTVMKKVFHFIKKALKS